MNENKKIKLATMWLDGCSGCHMSLLDMDEKLLELAGRIEVVYSPLVDAKTYPEGVDVAVVEGAVATDEDMEKVRLVRRRTRFLVALGDCSVTGNVPAMRNPFGLPAVVERAYFENAQRAKQRPTAGLPALLERVRPVHEVTPVDLFVPGCPPPAEAIYFVLSELLAGRRPDAASLTRFGR